MTTKTFNVTHDQVNLTVEELPMTKIHKFRISHGNCQWTINTWESFRYGIHGFVGTVTPSANCPVIDTYRMDPYGSPEAFAAAIAERIARIISRRLK